MLDEKVQEQRILVENIRMKIQEEKDIQQKMLQDLQDAKTKMKVKRDSLTKKLLTHYEEVEKKVTDQFKKFKSDSEDHYSGKKDDIEKDRDALNQRLDEVKNLDDTITEYKAKLEDADDYSIYRQNLSGINGELRRVLESMVRDENYPSANLVFVVKNCPIRSKWMHLLMKEVNNSSRFPLCLSLRQFPSNRSSQADH